MIDEGKPRGKYQDIYKLWDTSQKHGIISDMNDREILNIIEKKTLTACLNKQNQLLINQSIAFISSQGHRY